MKRIVVVMGALLLTAAASSNEGATRLEFTLTGTDIVPCLDYAQVEFSITIRAVEHGPFEDGSGGQHSVFNVRWSGTLDAVHSDMSWTSRGGGPFIRHSNGNNDQFVRVHERHERSFANGDYPDLLWTFGISFTRNANGDVVSLRLNPTGTYVCVPHDL